MPTRKKTMLYTRTIGEVLKAWRLEWPLTQDELSKRSGYGKGYLSRVENGVIGQPDDEHLLRLAAALQIRPEYLRDRRLPSDLLPDEREELEKTWRTTTNSTTTMGGVGYSAPIHESKSQLQEEDLLRQLLLFADELREEEEQLHHQLEQTQQKLARVKELQSSIEKLIMKVERGE